MAIILRDESTEAMVRKLAGRRKITMTAAVKLAVVNQLAYDEAEFERRWAEIETIQKRVAGRGQHPSMAEIDAEMYDEDGLPR